MFINSKHLLQNRFSWQEGFGAFTVGYRELDKVYKYVLNQEEHHSRVNFRKEYLKILVEEDIDYNLNYLFEFYE